MAIGGVVAGYGLHLLSNQLNDCYGASGLAMVCFAVVAVLIVQRAYRQFKGEG